MIDSWKLAIKKLALRKLHAREEIIGRLATKVVANGVPRYLQWNYQDERTAVLNYVKGMQVSPFGFTFSKSSTRPVLYASLYAFLLHGMFDSFEHRGHIDAWLDEFDVCQEEDGYFRDPVLVGDEFDGVGAWGDGWGVRHLAAHVIIAYARAERRPRWPLRFLQPYYDLDNLERWLGGFDLATGVWSQSNYIMNMYTLMQFDRDCMGEPRAALAVRKIGEFLLSRQNSATGMWHAGSALPTRAALNDAIRGAYHFYPLFEYDGIAVPHQEKVIDLILASQNAWGAFEEEDRPSGACEDIDAIDPLLRFARRTRYRDREVRLAAQRSLIWVLACRNPDGGSVSLLENGCHYGNHPQTSSAPGESNMFATWFRTLTIAYLTNYLGMEQNFNIGRYPGYEIPLPPADMRGAIT